MTRWWNYVQTEPAFKKVYNEIMAGLQVGRLPSLSPRIIAPYNCSTHSSDGGSSA